MDFRMIAAKQGWTQSTQLDLVLRFVGEQGFAPVLDDWAAQIADDEND